MKIKALENRRLDQLNSSGTNILREEWRADIFLSLGRGLFFDRWSHIAVKVTLAIYQASLKRRAILIEVQDRRVPRPMQSTSAEFTGRP